MAPWHHVGATMEIALDKKWIIEVIRWELNSLTCNWIKNYDLKKISSKWYTMNMKKLSEKRKTDGTYITLASQNDHTSQQASSLASVLLRSLRPLQEGKKKKETFLHLFRCYTHTRTWAYITIYYTHIDMYRFEHKHRQTDTNKHTDGVACPLMRSDGQCMLVKENSASVPGSPQVGRWSQDRQNTVDR